MNIFETWAANWYGFTSPTQESASSSWPYWKHLVDPTWNPNDKDQIVKYLETASTAAVSGYEDMDCPVCKNAKWNPSHYRSDGVWLWPSDLAHFVDEHQMRIPERFLVHIRASNYKPRDIKGIPVQSLPWPDQ